MKIGEAISYNPKQISDAIKNEKYELANSLSKDLKIPKQEHPYLFTRIEFLRNLDSYKFLNSENDKLKPAILSELNSRNPEVREIKDLSNNTVLTSEGTYIKVLNEHHINFGYIGTSNNTQELEDARLKNQHRDIQNNFTYHEKLGFLGPDPSHLGEAFKLQFGIALPHLYMDNQIQRISQACSDLGFTLKPMQIKKNSPLIYTLENKSSSNTTLKETITAAIQLGYAVKKAETHAQLKALESDHSYKLFASSYWSLGSLPSLTSEEYFSYIEDMICACLFNYLDKHKLQELTQLFQSQLHSILLLNDEQSDCDTSKVMNKDFEYFLNTLRS
ncbi:hypothetical protein [Lentisphaera araneosa]|nr:hypothetical protein [Lentisphaera araneosa]